jgi:hypothetical protein
MYKETLRGIAGIGVFPALSLVLFVLVFVVAVFRVVRMEHTDAEHFASLPLDGADPVTGPRQEARR